MPETTHKVLYRKLCAEEPTIPVFSRDWWLDAVCGEAWDVCLVKCGGRIVASMPYHYLKRMGLKILGQPPLTQTLGPWLRPTGAKYSNRLGREKDLLTALIDQLPEFALFHQRWHYSHSNWLPFFWRGFDQTTFYTYRLPALSDLDGVWSEFRDNVRTDIRKASGRFNLKVRTDLGIDALLALNIQTFERQGMSLPYSQELIRQLDAACAARNSRRIFIAEDEQGTHHAGVFIIWDEQSAYYLMSGGNPILRTSGATSLCIWEAIRFAATVTKSFDFEGSMIEPIERFFRAFGAVQTPYFFISKSTSRLIRTRNFFATLLKK